MFEDRDGNLWIGGPRGIERWRDGVFTTFSTAQRLPSESPGPLYVDAAGRTWFGPSAGGLYWLHHGRVGRVSEAGLDQDVVYSIAGDAEGLWIGRQRGGLTHLRNSGGEAAPTLTATVTNVLNGTVSYQWKKAGVAILGGTNSTYTLPRAMSLGDAGSYTCSVSDAHDGAVATGTSNAIVMNVLAPPVIVTDLPAVNYRSGTTSPASAGTKTTRPA